MDRLEHKRKFAFGVGPTLFALGVVLMLGYESPLHFIVGASFLIAGALLTGSGWDAGDHIEAVKQRLRLEQQKEELDKLR